MSPTISYLLTVLLFPDPLEETEDMEAHFFANRKRFFVLAAILPVIDAADTLLKGVDHFRAQGAIYPVTIATVFVCCLVGAGTRSRGYHAFFALFFLAYLLTFIAINLAKLA